MSTTYPALWFTSGTPINVGHTKLLARLESYIVPEPNTGCWLWTGGLWDETYGRINVEGQMRYAHRVVYELIKGTIPIGLTLDHLCRLTCCVNPDHLEPVTFAENMRRRPDVRAQREKVLCLRGHRIDGVHVWKHKRTRYCLTCHRENERVRRAQARNH